VNINFGTYFKFAIDINFHRIHSIVRAFLLFLKTRCRKNNPMRTGISHSSRRQSCAERIIIETVNLAIRPVRRISKQKRL